LLFVYLIVYIIRVPKMQHLLLVFQT